MRIAAAIAAIAAVTGAAQADALHDRLALLVARGENIYAEAEKVVVARPTTRKRRKGRRRDAGKDIQPG